LHLNGNEFYWSFKIHAGTEGGFSAIAEGEVYGLGDTDQLCRELWLGGGVEPLIGTLILFPLPDFIVNYLSDGLWRA
jgi:hypothetical protein